jgi:hypothetical protein
MDRLGVGFGVSEGKTEAYALLLVGSLAVQLNSYWQHRNQGMDSRQLAPYTLALLQLMEEEAKCTNKLPLGHAKRIGVGSDKRS